MQVIDAGARIEAIDPDGRSDVAHGPDVVHRRRPRPRLVGRSDRVFEVEDENIRPDRGGFRKPLGTSRRSEKPASLGSR